MPEIARDPAFDSTLALLFQGYEFIGRRCRRLGSDVFRTRLMLRPVICMRGPEAAQLFYDSERFTRVGAVPVWVRKTLFGEGGVQGLDGEDHRHRKALFMSLMTRARIAELAAAFESAWRTAARRWEAMDEVVLFTEVEELLCRVVCDWAGVPLPAADVRQRTQDFEAMIDAAGGLGPRVVRGIVARRRASRWIGRLIERIRTGELSPDSVQAAYRVAWYRNPDGALLSTEAAATELINVLRPTVAVSRFVVFEALALHRHPALAGRIRADQRQVDWFVQEVRRHSPFFPFLGARVREGFEWRGMRFTTGALVLLDLYGTNHHPEVWQDPETLRPERFQAWDHSPFTLVPQGGGDHAESHRCPGEWITIELMKVAASMLTGELRYEVPPQDLRLRLTRIPAIPESRFLMRNVRALVRGERPSEPPPPGADRTAGL